MDEFRPTNPHDGRRYDSYTDWHISWNWPGYGSNECDLTKAQVDYEVWVVAPRWMPEANATPDLIDLWVRYSQNLSLHEQQHVDNIVDNYLQAKDAIQNATCATAEEAAQAILEKFRQFDVEYDRTTNHGETQGARFP